MQRETSNCYCCHSKKKKKKDSCFIVLYHPAQEERLINVRIPLCTSPSRPPLSAPLKMPRGSGSLVLTLHFLPLSAWDPPRANMLEFLFISLVHICCATLYILIYFPWGTCAYFPTLIRKKKKKEKSQRCSIHFKLHLTQRVSENANWWLYLKKKPTTTENPPNFTVSPFLT